MIRILYVFQFAQHDPVSPRALCPSKSEVKERSNPSAMPTSATTAETATAMPQTVSAERTRRRVMFRYTRVNSRMAVVMVGSRLDGVLARIGESVCSGDSIAFPAYGRNNEYAVSRLTCEQVLVRQSHRTQRKIPRLS